MSAGARAALPLLGVAACAWLLVLWQSAAMPGMGGGLLPAGVAMPPDLPPAAFLGTWLTMMAAMMLPAISPVVAARPPAGSLVPTGAFTAGFLTLWTAAGLVPLALFALLRALPQDALMGRGGMAAAAVLAGAGLYQFTGWKSACLRACREPHDLAGVRAGLAYGVRCVGCCWALMAVLLVVGVMNLAWMAALTAVFVCERYLVHQLAVTRVAGAALVAVGLLIAASSIRV